LKQKTGNDGRMKGIRLVYIHEEVEGSLLLEQKTGGDSRMKGIITEYMRRK
jgi:hypothetical protein